MSSQPPIILEEDGCLTAIVSLGSNLASTFGSPREVLELALVELAVLSSQPPRVSSLYETEPVDCESGTANFVNAVVALRPQSQSSPAQLLHQLHEIEAAFGRQRGDSVNQPRSLDLDLICYGLHQISESGLQLPHPQAHQRRFVLQPLAELAPELILPGQNVTVQLLLSQLPDIPAVVPLSA